MALLSRPWFRLMAVAGLTILGFVLFGVGVFLFSDPPTPLPYHDSLVGGPHLLREWDSDVSRARYAADGYEVLVKQPGRTAASIPETWHEWDLSIRVTVEFRRMSSAWSDDDPVPTAGVLCAGDDVDYDVRVGVDGRYAVYRWTGVGRARTATLLASNSTLARPKVAMDGPVRLLVECQRRSPTTVRLTVDGNEVVSVSDTAARNWGQIGVIVGSGDERNVTAVFRDLSIMGR